MTTPNSIRSLGPRLRAIAERVVPGFPVADLCCDHARLAVALVNEDRVPRAIAGDINTGPLASAAEALARLGLNARIELRHGDGVAVLEPGDATTVVIAGVGAPLAERIVRAGQASGKLAGVARLIVQPNHGFPKLGSLRAALDGLGWTIVDEAIACDQGRLYVIVVAEPGAVRLRDEADRELGPVLRRGDDPLAAEWFERERARVERALTGMDRGRFDVETLAHYRRYLTLLEP